VSFTALTRKEGVDFRKGGIVGLMVYSKSGGPRTGLVLLIGHSQLAHIVIVGVTAYFGKDLKVCRK
jgi:hypothetical protein